MVCKVAIGVYQQQLGNGNNSFTHCCYNMTDAVLSYVPRLQNTYWVLCYTDKKSAACKSSNNVVKSSELAG
jgi:hypothetical protein